MADIYNANTGEGIKNGSSVVKIPHGTAQSYSVRAYTKPEIATLSGQHDTYDKYPRYYTGDTDN